MTDRETLRCDQLLTELVALAARVPDSPVGAKVIEYAIAAGHPGRILGIPIDSWGSARMIKDACRERDEAREQERLAYHFYARRGSEVERLEDVLRRVTTGPKSARLEARAEAHEMLNRIGERKKRIATIKEEVAKLSAAERAFQCNQAIDAICKWYNLTLEHEDGQGAHLYYDGEEGVLRTSAGFDGASYVEKRR